MTDTNAGDAEVEALADLVEQLETAAEITGDVLLQDAVKVVRATTSEAAKLRERVAELEGRYEDWKPISEPPHETLIERGVLLNFYRDEDEGTWWNGTWDERRDADIWCQLVTARLNDRALKALENSPATLADATPNQKDLSP